MKTPLSILKESNLSNRSIEKILLTWKEQDLYDTSKIDYMKMAIEEEFHSMYTKGKSKETSTTKDKAAAEAFGILYYAYTDLYLINHNWEVADDYENYLDQKLDYLNSLNNEELLNALGDATTDTIKEYGALNDANYMNIVVYMDSRSLVGDNTPKTNHDINLKQILELIKKHNIALEAEDVLVEMYEEENDSLLNVPADKEQEYDNYLNNLKTMTDDEKLRLLESYDISKLREYETNHALLKEYLESKEALKEAEAFLEGPKDDDIDTMLEEANEILKGRSK